MKRITIELTEQQAAGLKRFAEKSGWSEAQAVLYAHVSKDIRDAQAYYIIEALSVLIDALDDVRTWPWIETGDASDLDMGQ